MGKVMEIGDLVEIFTDDQPEHDDRKIGTVVGLDFWVPDDPPRSMSETIVLCLWDTGRQGWILKSRVRVINETG